MKTIMNIRTAIRPASVLERATEQARPLGGCWFSLGLSRGLKHQAGYVPDRLKVSG